MLLSKLISMRLLGAKFFLKDEMMSKLFITKLLLTSCDVTLLEIADVNLIDIFLR